MQMFENRFQSASFRKQYHYCLHVNYKNANLGIENAKMCIFETRSVHRNAQVSLQSDIAN